MERRSRSRSRERRSGGTSRWGLATPVPPPSRWGLQLPPIPITGIATPVFTPEGSLSSCIPCCPNPFASYTLSLPTPAKVTSFISSCASVEELESLIQKHTASFNALHHAAICTSASRLGRLLSSATATAISILLRAASSWVSYPPGSFGRGARQASNILHSFAILQVKSTPLFFDISVILNTMLHELNPQEAVNSLWAIASCAVYSECIFPRFLWENLIVHCSTLSSRFNGQNAANALWASARLGVGICEPVSAFIKVAAHLSRLRFLKPLELAASCWAVGYLHYPADKHIEQLFSSATSMAAFFSPQQISNVITGSCKLGLPCTVLFVTAAKTVETQSPQGLSALLSSAAALQVKNRDIICAFVAATAAATFTFPESVSTLTSIALLGFDAMSLISPSFLELAIFSAHTPSSLSSVLYATANVCVRGEMIPYLFFLRSEIVRLRASLSQRDLVTILWALSILDSDHKFIHSVSFMTFYGNVALYTLI
jgi:hypothetical protein